MSLVVQNFFETVEHFASVALKSFIAKPVIIDMKNPLSLQGEGWGEGDKNLSEALVLFVLNTPLTLSLSPKGERG